MRSFAVLKQPKVKKQIVSETSPNGTRISMIDSLAQNSDLTNIFLITFFASILKENVSILIVSCYTFRFMDASR